MIKQFKHRGPIFLLGISIILSSLWIDSVTTVTEEKTEQITGSCYEFDDKNKYEIDGASPSASITPQGKLSVEGNYKSSTTSGEPSYDVSSGNLNIKYSFDLSILNNPAESWHLYDDGIKTVNGIELDQKVGYGSIIIQTSLDKSRWNIDTIKTNAFTADYNSDSVLYSTKDIQLINGCYYRIIVTYEEEMVTGTSTVLFVTTEDKARRRIAEVYEFYAVNSSEKSMSNANTTPRKELGSKMGVKKDTGYSQEVTIDAKDPHYGWNIGTFSVNGYTREMEGPDKNEMFLKNAGDRVTLWFNLSKDIYNLTGDNKYSIVEDKNGSDQYFEVPQTNFKHGTLIIRFTDHEGVKHDPIIYTDFLAANATTGADTKAVLFEEGDYEVALDYSIGETGFFGSEKDYRIFFKFSIRNGNTMFFPFDLSTKDELRDNAITPNGFMIDMAKSRYLNINVTRTAIVEGPNGHTEDVRFNGPAKDGNEYKDEGVYTVDVTNQYTNEHTVKTFYVGSDPFMIAMAKSGKTVKELDEFLEQGYTIDADGSLVAPPEPEPEPEAEEEIVEEVVTVDEAVVPTEAPKFKVEESADAEPDDSITKESEQVSPAIFENKGIIVGASVAVALIIIVLVSIGRKKKSKKGSDNKSDDEEGVG